MKKNRFIALAALILGLFFLIQFISELIFFSAKGMEPKKRLLRIDLAIKLFPLADGFQGDAGFQLLADASAKSDVRAAKRSIEYFQAALKRNPLDYQSRYYLAKAHLLLSAEETDRFDMAVTELTRAVRLRGSNKQIALDCGRIFFSVWPLLEAKDKEFAAKLLVEAVPAFSWAEFSPLLEMWSFYVQDTPLLMSLLQAKPAFFGPSANQLVAVGIALEKRFEMLDLYETYTVDTLERRYNELMLSGNIGLNDSQSLLNQLRALKGYNRLNPESGFPKEKAARFQRSLLLDVVRNLLYSPSADPKTTARLRELIAYYVMEHNGLNELDELHKLLNEKKYFQENDFPSLRLKTQIAYKKGDYNGVISEIEALRKGISFVKKEQKADYTEILLMLVDSYFNTKLMTVAEEIAGELVREQPDNPDILWRVLRIQRVMGDDGIPDMGLHEKFGMVENSRFITMAKPKAVFNVFLLNEPQIEITLDPAFLPTLKPKQLLQVFVDGKIAFESYVDVLPEKIAICPPFVEIESKVQVQVKII